MSRSIVIPAYNSESTVGALVERLVAELGSDMLQVVLVNDGSADRTDAVCRELATTMASRARIAAAGTASTAAWTSSTRRCSG